jgi:predicted  nucleic acid-binding Zn-ribbon protein
VYVYMRAPAALLSIVVACAVGGVVGYGLANRTNSQEIARLQQERDNGLVRERELRTQLQEALAARAALAQEAQHLQEDLLERLRRLEEAAAKLTPSVKPGTSTEE